MARTRKTSLEANGGSSATMLNIAEKLNISVATVSRALRRVPGINADTRALVLQTASELGYRLQESYRQEPLDKNQLIHVGVFIETTQTTLFHPYLTGLSEAAMALNSSLVIHHVNPEECERILDPAYQPQAMRSGLLSGIVLIFWWPTEVIKVLSEKLPIVSIMHRYPGTNADMVGLDNEGGMDALVRELYKNGHRRIAFLGRCSKLQWSSGRFGGYVTALTSFGLEYRSEWVVDVDSETLSSKYAKWDGYGAVIDRIHREGVTAWVSATEPAGWALHEWMTKRGIRVPQEVSITGFHRPSLREPSMPDLTSIGASCEGIGSAALRRLHHRIQNPVETSRIVCFPCEYYAGSTIGPAPADKTTRH